MYSHFMSNNQYHIKNADKFFRINASIVEYEIDLSSTVTMFNLIDLTKIEVLRKAQGEKKLSYTVFIAKALAIALREYSEINKRFYSPFGILPRKFQIFDTVDIAVASEISDPKFAHIAYIGVMRDVQNKSLSEIQNWLLKFRETESVQQWKLFSNLISNLPFFLANFIIRLPLYFPRLWREYRGGSCIISSPAKYGVDGLVAAWSSPIGVSFGFVKERPVVKEGKITSAPCFNLTINFDRRILSGAQAARFISKVSEVLEKAEFE